MNDMGPFWDAICLLDKAVVNKKTSEMYRPAQRVLEAAGKVEVVWAGDAPIINDNADFKRLFEAIISALPAGSRE